MLDVLREVEKRLPPMLYEEHQWESLCIDYETPHVWRLWRQFDESHRVFLHKLFPCDTALVHPHPWPSAVRVLGPDRAVYETGVGYGPTDGEAPPMAMRLELRNGSLYEMLDPLGWHYVRPRVDPIYSLMVTGRPYDRARSSKQARFGHGVKLVPLTNAQRLDVFGHFRDHYVGN